jgi:tetratricopeptide (TPR) repeat protein
LALVGAKFSEARQMALKAEDEELAASIDATEARALFNARKYSEGLALATSQLGTTRKLADQRLTAQLLNTAGLCKLLLEQNRDAAELFTEAIPLERAADQPYELAATLQNLSAAHLLLGDYRGSLKEADDALTIRRTLRDRTREAFSMLGMAKAHVCLGEPQPALDAYGALIPLWRELKDPVNEAASYSDIGTVYTDVGAWDEARAAYRSALRLRETAQDSAGESETLVNLGRLELLTHEYRKALPEFERALAVPQKTSEQRMEGYALAGRGEALFHLTRKAEALESLKKSVEVLEKVGDKSGEAVAWRILGEIETSAEDYRRALVLAHEVGDRPSEAIFLNDLAHWERDKGQLTQARQTLEQEIPIIESSRADLSNPELRMSYLSASRDAYELYVDVLARTGGGTELASFQASECGHARVLLDEIGLDHSPVEGSASLDEIRSGLLGENTVLLEYLLGERRSWLWFVSRSEFRRFELPGRAELERLAQAFYSTLIARNVNDPRETPERRAERWQAADAQEAAAAVQLRRLLLGPVWERVGAARVLIVNDGLLHLVPFAALGIHGEVVLVPSATAVLAARREGSSKTANLLILADPDTGANSGFTRLPSTRMEANRIESLGPRGQVEKRLGAEASTARLREAAERFGMIHIAAHAVLDSRNPERSGIVLSSGILRLRDIYDLRLKTSLVTLSACETAMGKEVHGEGMIGLSRAFLYAGARRVVASSWKVEDGATEWFMEAFYRNIY